MKTYRLGIVRLSPLPTTPLVVVWVIILTTVMDSLALRILVTLGRARGTSLLILSGELRENGAEIRLHLWLRLYRLMLGETGPLLELLHHAHELLEVHTARDGWWRSDGQLWNLGDLSLGLLLAEHADGPLEVGQGRLLGNWRRGHRLLLRGPGLDYLQ